MRQPSTSEFRDPVHGFILIYPHERKIIDTPEFQRLRRIHQLGLTHYVYHGAEHSRFGHSLGVMHLAGKAVEAVVQRNLDIVRATLKWSNRRASQEQQRLVWLARLAGLLHDVGHAPFSHTGERSLFQPNMRHEQYSEAIITRTPIGRIIDEECQAMGLSKELVAQVVTGQATLPAGFLQELISSAWDVDKMDYLLRDSLYCGVQYGRFDLDRLLNTITLDSEDPSGGLKLAIESDGFHTLEAFVLARYFMFTQVYFHDVRRAFDLVLTQLIQEILSQTYGSSQYPAPDQLEDYLRVDDAFILAEAARLHDASIKNAAWRVTNRHHPVAVYQTTPSPDEGIARKVQYHLPAAARQRFPDLQFWSDQAVDHPQRFRSEVIMVKFPGNPPSWRSFERESRALRGLEEIGQVRLYADVRGDDALQSEVEAYCRDFMK
ncbi:MAG: HD domain-containing protein [Chloroflexi bacterium]|nr:HD domain-containing protein [Chloroflexota bacterium]